MTEKYESKFCDCRRSIVSKFEEFFENKIAALPTSKELSMIKKSEILASSDYNSVYPSAKAHPDSRWAKI